jgi:hypothetical protein
MNRLEQTLTIGSGVAVLLAVTACYPQPPTAPPTPPAPNTPAAAVAGPLAIPRPPKPPPGFAAYRAFDGDPFPGGPATWNPFSPPSTWPSSGSPRWSWGFSGTPTGGPLHYVVLHGRSDDDPDELAVRAHAPVATLPAGARLLYFGKSWSDTEWVFESVAVAGEPYLVPADVASCTLADADDHHTGPDGDTVRKRPWLQIRYTKAGEAKLAKLPPKTPLVVAFGESALSMGWFPNWTDTTWTASDFPVEGMTADEQRARANALVAACGATRLAR